MREKASQLVAEMAREFAELLEEVDEGWKEGFFRFNANESSYGAKGSYSGSRGIQLLSVFAHDDFFQRMSNMAQELRNAVEKDGKKFCVCLLTVRDDFDYDVKFEYEDMDRWQISRTNGGSGLPTG